MKNKLTDFDRSIMAFAMQFKSWNRDELELSFARSAVTISTLCAILETYVGEANVKAVLQNPYDADLAESMMKEEAK